MKTTDQKIQALLELSGHSLSVAYSRSKGAEKVHIIISLVDVMTRQQFIEAVDALYIKVSGAQL
jgi:hypothetical protein